MGLNQSTKADERGEAALEEGGRSRSPTTPSETSSESEAAPWTWNTSEEDEEDYSPAPELEAIMEAPPPPPAVAAGGLEEDAGASSPAYDEYGRTEYRVPATEEASFNVLLNCTGSSSSFSSSEARSSRVHNSGSLDKRTKTLVIKEGMPLRVKDLKHCIEQEYSIPACCQSLVLENVTLEDRLELESYRVRDGDTIRVDYVSDGDVAEILDVVYHMTCSYRFIASIQDDLSHSRASHDLNTLVNREVRYSKVGSLPEIYFTPCASERAEANRKLFIQCGGLDMLCKLHGLLLRQPWCRTPLMMQYLEHAILRTYWNITAAFTVRMHVLRYPSALQCILRSFLRLRLDPSAMTQVPHNPFTFLSGISRGELNKVSCEVVYKAMGGLCK